VIDARVTLRKTGRNFQALCPFHDEKTASFSVNPEETVLLLLRLRGDRHRSDVS
jgi:DNA primase